MKWKDFRFINISGSFEDYNLPDIKDTQAATVRKM